MKKVFFLMMIMLVFVCLFSSCLAPEDKVLYSLGTYKNYEFYTQGEFQDYTDYGKYYFENVNIDDNNYFTQIQIEDLKIINEHLDDFECFIESYREKDSTREIVANYDFDRSMIDTEDYFYIDSEKDVLDDGTVFLSSYDVYFFDVQTKVLYYFHNNL